MLNPQTTTEPSARRAAVCPPPAATSTNCCLPRLLSKTHLPQLTISVCALALWPAARNAAAQLIRRKDARLALRYMADPASTLNRRRYGRSVKEGSEDERHEALHARAVGGVGFLVALAQRALLGQDAHQHAREDQEPERDAGDSEVRPDSGPGEEDHRSVDRIA